ncbi:MAG: hypothetical protein WKF30_11085, partial [Pyrinomonadaceae bacterium]
ANILTALVNRAASFAPRVAFFVIKNDFGIGWRARGLEGSVGDDSIREIAIPLTAKTLLGDTVELRATWSGEPGANAEDHLILEKLGGPAPQRMVAVPLVARHKVAAVLYADSAELGPEAINLEALEALMRVAGISVELLAAKRQTGASVAAEPPRQPERPIAPTPAPKPSAQPPQPEPAAAATITAPAELAPPPPPPPAALVEPMASAPSSSFLPAAPVEPAVAAPATGPELIDTAPLEPSDVFKDQVKDTAPLLTVAAPAPVQVEEFAVVEPPSIGGARLKAAPPRLIPRRRPLRRRQAISRRLQRARLSGPRANTGGAKSICRLKSTKAKNDFT